MDFESIGMAMGYRRNMDALEDAANIEIGKANREIKRLRDELKEANRRNEALSQEKAQVTGAMHVEAAYRAGLLAQASALRAELNRVDPGNNLLKPTGRKYEDGLNIHAVISVIFEKAFDGYLGKLVKSPEKYRPNAK